MYSLSFQLKFGHPKVGEGSSDIEKIQAYRKTKFAQLFVDVSIKNLSTLWFQTNVPRHTNVLLINNYYETVIIINKYSIFMKVSLKFE